MLSSVLSEQQFNYIEFFDLLLLKIDEKESFQLKIKIITSMMMNHQRKNRDIKLEVLQKLLLL